jgi:hypothetical protein
MKFHSNKNLIKINLDEAKNKHKPSEELKTTISVVLTQRFCLPTSAYSQDTRVWIPKSLTDAAATVF